MASTSPPEKTGAGMMLVCSYGALLAVNALTVYGAHLYFPGNVVLGTLHIPKVWAILHSMGALALINTFAVPFVRCYERKTKRELQDRDCMIVNFLVNFTGIWVITRFADQMGLGITSWMVAAVLALVLAVIQRFVLIRLRQCRSLCA